MYNHVHYKTIMLFIVLLCTLTFTTLYLSVSTSLTSKMSKIKYKILAKINLNVY